VEFGFTQVQEAARRAFGAVPERERAVLLLDDVAGCIGSGESILTERSCSCLGIKGQICRRLVRVAERHQVFDDPAACSPPALAWARSVMPCGPGSL